MVWGEEYSGSADEVRCEGQVFIRAVRFTDVEVDEECAV